MEEPITVVPLRGEEKVYIRLVNNHVFCAVFSKEKNRNFLFEENDMENIFSELNIDGEAEVLPLSQCPALEWSIPVNHLKAWV
jgi:hypothetical protein